MVDYYGRTEGPQFERDRPPDAARGAGDDDGLIFE
jgi:hypothetical protein